MIIKIVAVLLIAFSFTACSYEPTPNDLKAVERAEGYLNAVQFSHSGLISQLEYEGFTTSEATYGADNCGADWNYEAERYGRYWLENKPETNKEDMKFFLIEVVEFTESQAEHAVNQIYK